MPINYKTAGVDIDNANETKKQMADDLKSDDKRVLNKLGAFASLYDIKFPEYKHPLLVLKTEEPGSKQLLAIQYDRIESICFDMINHLVNDCIVMGAKPLTVQDAIICGKLKKEVVLRMVKAMSRACQAQGCSLTGGETSEQPGVLVEDTYILTSSIVGIVEKESVIDGSQIMVGDKILALESSGLHTNGYTLIRKLIQENPSLVNEKIGDTKFIEAVLEPHRCYYNAIKDLFPTKKITGLAHITGGGIKENLNRILPKNMNAKVDLSLYQILPIFKFLKSYAKLEDAELLRTFNMSVGLTMVVKKEAVGEIIMFIQKKGVNCYEIGGIVDGNGVVETTGQLRYD
ncbi:MAG: phosphoribosylformylglycinamidine cyclo-ligase [Patescibacteria group bacterium]